MLQREQNVHFLGQVLGLAVLTGSLLLPDELHGDLLVVIPVEPLPHGGNGSLS